MIMTTTRFKVFANLYKDSVTLMQLGAQLRERDGIGQASCLMATPANLAQLQDADLSIDTQASPSDLLVVVRGDPSACEEAIQAADAMLQAKGAAGDGAAAAFSPPLTSLALGVESNPDADLALISVPGDYAAAEAMKALALGLHVMLFSDNVSIAEERAIKTFARAKGLLVMGPDCGTAIVNGVPLGFANVVRRGDIGLVAASGTGLQEVTCRIHNLGGGISQALGTGGRDLKEEIGGITMLQGLAALADCPNVVIKISELGLPHGTWDVPSNIRVVREAATIFGPDRIIFASNLPVAGLSTTFGGIVDVMRTALAKETPETLGKFFTGNAIRFYRMPIQLP